MAKLFLLLAALVFISYSTLAIAKSENSNNPGSEKKQSDNATNKGQAKKLELNAEDATPSATCAPEAQWKNHGDYVSCVAKLKLGGATVSEAAKSDIGKKKSSTPSASISPSPSATSSSSASPSASPVATQSASLADQVEEIVSTIRGLLQRLLDLFSL